MRIALVCPAPRGSRVGNRVTAIRWARMLRALGHRVEVTSTLDARAFDVLFALHARRSAGAVDRARALHPDRPIVVALTGTDLYRDIHRDPDAKRSLEIADRLVVLHPLAVEELPKRLRPKVR